MPKLPALFLLPITFFFFVTPLSSQPADAEKQVAALEAQWLEAQKTSNPALLEPLLADTFFNVSTDSTVSNRAETLQLLKAAKFASAEYLDVKITVYGQTAIASGIFRGKGVDGSESSERWTDTWVKMPSAKSPAANSPGAKSTNPKRAAWQCVASHASPIKK